MWWCCCAWWPSFSPFRTCSHMATRLTSSSCPLLPLICLTQPPRSRFGSKKNQDQGNSIPRALFRAMPCHVFHGAGESCWQEKWWHPSFSLAQTSKLTMRPGQECSSTTTHKYRDTPRHMAWAAALYPKTKPTLCSLFVRGDAPSPDGRLCSWSTGRQDRVSKCSIWARLGLVHANHHQRPGRGRAIVLLGHLSRKSGQCRDDTRRRETD
ncbi:hypothetical protein IWZ00DRAFT_372311 [Phyllosticta capitalensis]|uniref:uncharacterized protein n=1 Tax=Phyllosticta capitalensis TaxID=121624 RepID=UPI0031315E25